MTLTRRSLTLALAAAPVSALALPALAQKATTLSAEDQALVDRAVAYLQGLSEAKGSFVQVDPRGVTTRGTLYLKRPGKARFEYEPKAGLLVVSDGGNVSIHNTKLKTFDRYPLMATPLSLFLAKQIRLDRGVRVTRVSRYAGGFSITARDAGKTAEGQITLTFTDAPLRLAAWTVTDAQGQSTQVRLETLEPTSGLAASLFVLNDPRPKGVGRGKM
jgi:outer membrane lipoprotein-sorting protein